MKTQYDVIHGPAGHEFINMVNDRIAAGWQAVGGVAVVVLPEQTPLGQLRAVSYCYQAVIKTD